ncbi:MAG: DUF6291 domain-containing protein [Treponema sp.]|jgi:hypothetical protein|nr:DUF6291 domain-containing protein [Treponema sp.]
MAEKYSVLIKYKYLDYIENAKLSDADAWVFLKGIIEYDKSGSEPTYVNPVLTGLFAVVKSDLDQNREKWDAVSEERSEAGKKGAEKRWGKKKENNSKNGNSHKDIAKDSKDGKCQKKQKNMAKMHDLDSGGDLDLGSEYESGGGNDLEENQNSEQPPPPIEQIKKESQAQGFFIDSAVAKKFQSCGLDPPWLLGPHTFLEFTAITVRKKYPDKGIDALKPIFIAAVKSWEDIREAYPAWRSKEIKKDKDAALEKAKRNEPKKCHCGGDLDIWLRCKTCKGHYEFNEKIVRYEFHERESESLSDDYFKRMNERFNGGSSDGRSSDKSILP